MNYYTKQIKIVDSNSSLTLPQRRTDVDVQYHYELKPFETERALIRQAEARLKRMLETAPRREMERPTGCLHHWLVD